LPPLKYLDVKILEDSALMLNVWVVLDDESPHLCALRLP